MTHVFDYLLPWYCLVIPFPIKRLPNNETEVIVALCYAHLATGPYQRRETDEVGKKKVLTKT